jgi:hypothetical protein
VLFFIFTNKENSSAVARRKQGISKEVRERIEAITYKFYSLKSSKLHYKRERWMGP